MHRASGKAIQKKTVQNSCWWLKAVAFRMPIPLWLGFRCFPCIIVLDHGECLLLVVGEEFRFRWCNCWRINIRVNTAETQKYFICTLEKLPWGYFFLKTSMCETHHEHLIVSSNYSSDPLSFEFSKPSQPTKSKVSRIYMQNETSVWIQWWSLWALC